MKKTLEIAHKMCVCVCVFVKLPPSSMCPMQLHLRTFLEDTERQNSSLADSCVFLLEVWDS